MVHTGTRQVYGRVDRLPVDEHTAARPMNALNGVAAGPGEHLHMVYSHAHRMPITSLRLTNVYGPRQRLTSDEIGFLPALSSARRSRARRSSSSVVANGA